MKPSIPVAFSGEFVIGLLDNLRGDWNVALRHGSGGRDGAKAILASPLPHRNPSRRVLVRESRLAGPLRVELCQRVLPCLLMGIVPDGVVHGVVGENVLVLRYRSAQRAVQRAESSRVGLDEGQSFQTAPVRRHFLDRGAKPTEPSRDGLADVQVALPCTDDDRCHAEDPELTYGPAHLAGNHGELAGSESPWLAETDDDDRPSRIAGVREEEGLAQRASKRPPLCIGGEDEFSVACR